MSLRTLVSWLQVTELERTPRDQVRCLVQAALAELEANQADPECLQELQELDRLLAEGELPRSRLARLADWLPPEDLDPEDAVLERSLRDLALELPRSHWHTLTYDEIEQAVGFWRLGDTEPLQEALAPTRERLQQVWDSYGSLPVAPAEVTVETVVGHRLLQEAFEGWFQALDWLEEPDLGWKDALALAESANRLLIVVQRHAARVEAQGLRARAEISGALRASKRPSG